jgi:Fe-S-cluster containining protein
MSDGPRYLTLASARALECNGCGDCCDSRRTDGYWTWGTLPAHQYRALLDGHPLIIPLMRVEGGWVDRPHEPADTDELSRTNFRCEAFEPHEDGTGGCGIHHRGVPAICRAFPVGGEDVETDLDACGEHWLATSAFPRCTWYRTVVVKDGDARAERA